MGSSGGPPLLELVCVSATGAQVPVGYFCVCVSSTGAQVLAGNLFVCVSFHWGSSPSWYNQKNGLKGRPNLPVLHSNLRSDRSEETVWTSIRSSTAHHQRSQLSHCQEQQTCEWLLPISKMRLLLQDRSEIRGDKSVVQFGGHLEREDTGQSSDRGQRSR